MSSQQKTKWTDERAAELVNLAELLQDCRMLNRGSGAIERMQRIIEAANELGTDNIETGRLGFERFLHALAIEDRQPNQKL